MKKNDPTSSVIPDIVIITGMSGSGRTQALHVFEDMGYFCIDNLPPALILQLSNLVGINTGVGRHLAVTCDLRSQGLFDDISEALKSLADHELTYKIVYLDSSDEVLMRRYSVAFVVHFQSLLNSSSWMSACFPLASKMVCPLRLTL